MKRIAVPGGTVACDVAGESRGKTPLLVLHGGPGAGMVSVEPVLALADERPVVRYDQLGCGASDRPEDPSAFALERFVAEVDAVRDALGLAEVHLLGHSWGAMLALEYALTHPVKSLVLSNGLASLAQFREEVERLVAAMHPEIREILQGDREARDYGQAIMAFYMTHLVRVEPPPQLMETFRTISESTTYVPMWGPDELHITGTLDGWERRDRLGEVKAPTLILVGEHDECTPALARTMQEGIARARLHLFPNASHFTFFEQPEAWTAVVREFLSQHDS